MNTHLQIRTRSTLGWAPALGYLLTIAGGLAITAVGCRENTTSAAPLEGERPVAAQVLPAVNTSSKTQALPTTSEAASPKPSATVASVTPDPKTAGAPTSPNPAIAEQPASLEVKRFVVTSAIDNREPTTTGETLKLGEPVFAFAELVAGKGAAARVEVVFEHEGGRKVGHAQLEIPADKPRWRTWAQSRNVNKLGQWSAVLLDGERNELARVKFEVTPAAPVVASETLQGG